MAFSRSAIISLTLTILVLILSQPLRAMNADDEVRDILAGHGFPVGLLPNNIKSYKIDDYGYFEVELTSECEVQFTDDQLVYYSPKIMGKLSYGEISNVVGITAKKFFTWVPVTGILVDHAYYNLVFRLLFLSESLSISLFQAIPVCKSKLTHVSI